MHPKFELSHWYMEQRVTAVAVAAKAAAAQPAATGILEVPVTLSAGVVKAKAKRVGAL